MTKGLLTAVFVIVSMAIMAETEHQRDLEKITRLQRVAELQQAPPFMAIVPLVPPPTLAPTRSPPILPPEPPAPHVHRENCWCLPVVPVSFVAEEMP